MEHLLNSLRQTLREVATRLRLPAFWQWWTTELAALAPKAPRTAWQRRRLRPIVAFDDSTAVLWEPRVVDGALVLLEAAQVPTAGDAAAVAQAGRTMVATLPRSTSPGAPIKVVIALPRSHVLRKQLTLPAAVAEHLRETIAYDLDRHTPFRADQLYFDAVVIGHDLAKKEIRVDWAAARRTVVDAARRHVEGWGATVVGVTPDAPQTGSGSVVPPARWSKLNLLPEEDRPDLLFWRRPAFLIPVALLALMALVAIVLPIWQKRDYVIALAAMTEEARVQAAASDALREQLDRATGDYNFALVRKYAFPSTVQLLDDVTKILPDDTWLTQLEVKSSPKGKEVQREIMLRGESANAGLLVSALEGSKLFEQAAPRSPTTKIQPGPGEVFDLGAQLKGLPPPELVKVVNAAPTPGGAPHGVPLPRPAPAGPAVPQSAGAPPPAPPAAGLGPGEAAIPGAAVAAPGAAPPGAGAPATAAAPAAPAGETATPPGARVPSGAAGAGRRQGIRGTPPPGTAASRRAAPAPVPPTDAAPPPAGPVSPPPAADAAGGAPEGGEPAGGEAPAEAPEPAQGGAPGTPPEPEQ